VKASERIHQTIESQISAGTLLPGDPIDEDQLCTQFGVSRTPVREALLQLKASGLLSSLPRGGMVVAKMDIAQLFAMWELLAELEGMCARYACERMGKPERDALADAHRASEQCVIEEDAVGWQQANKAFHEIIYVGARNPYIRQEILRTRTRTQAYRQHAFGAIGRLRTSFEGHGRILAAVLARDPAAAGAAAFSHLSHGDNAPEVSAMIMNLPRELLG
jgi:DNA-binding GntR family transcriptional regulator